MEAVSQVIELAFTHYWLVLLMFALASGCLFALADRVNSGFFAFFAIVTAIAALFFLGYGLHVNFTHSVVNFIVAVMLLFGIPLLLVLLVVAFIADLFKLVYNYNYLIDLFAGAFKRVTLMVWGGVLK